MGCPLIQAAQRVLEDGLIIGLPDTRTALPSLTPIGRDRCMPPLRPMLAEAAGFRA